MVFLISRGKGVTAKGQIVTKAMAGNGVIFLALSAYANQSQGFQLQSRFHAAGLEATVDNGAASFDGSFSVTAAPVLSKRKATEIK